MKALTRNEIDACLELSNIRERAMILVSYSHGMRASECIGLLRSDVDMDRRIITVRRLKRSLTSKQPISDATYEALRVWLSVAPESLYVFAMPSGARIKRLTWYRWFQAIAFAAGVPKEKAHPHALKHALGFALAAANITMPVIKMALGHKSISSTAVYTEMDDDTVGKIVLDALK